MPGTEIFPYPYSLPSPISSRKPIENLESRLHLSVSQNAAGWTVVTPSADTLTIYVSSSQGNDANAGTSQNAPVKSLSRAASLVRSGSPDWILLASGDTFNDAFSSWSKSGRSAQEPMLISSYGTGARPVIQSRTAHGGFFTNGSANVSNLDIIGLQFYEDQRDPNSPTFNTAAGGGGAGFEDTSPGSNILIENCSFSFYRNNLDIEALNGPQSNITLRRSVSDYSWSTISHSQGLYAFSVDHLTIDQDVFDHNGWNDLVPGATQAGYNHNIYYSYSCTNVTVEDSILANASFAGIMARAGGNIIDNLFLQNTIAISYGNANGADSTAGGVSGQITGNVIVGDKALGSLAYGQGFDIGNTNGVLVANNIFTQDSQHAKDAIQLDMATGTYNPSATVGENNLTIKNNIVNGWYRGMNIDGRFQPGGTGLYGFNNVSIEDNTFLNSTNHLFRQDGAIDSSQETLAGNDYYDTNLPSNSWFLLQGSSISTAQWKSSEEPTASMLGSMPPYVDANRSAATYDAKLGGAGTLSDFLAHADQLSAGNYQTQYTALAMIDYMRAGFALSASPLTAQPPTAAGNANNVTAASIGATSYTFTVTYTDTTTLDTSSLNSNDILVSGPKGYSSFATFVGLSGPFINSQGIQSVMAIYRITPPGGAWASGQDGTYTLTLRPGEVSDMNGTTALGAQVGSFSVDLTPPSAAVSAGNLDNSALGQSLYVFTVTYTDSSGIDASTVATEALEVTGPGGYDQAASFMGSSSSGNQSITATYTIHAPGGAWDVSAAGTYAILAHAGGLKDTFGNPIAAATLATFTANFTDVTPVSTGSISGFVYVDANGNGVMDRNETPMVGVIVYADRNGNGQLDPGELFTKTDSNGAYLFSSLAAGDYSIREQAPAGYVLSSPMNGSVDLNLSTGEAEPLVNFANQQVNQVVLGSGQTPISTTPTSGRTKVGLWFF